MPVPQRVNFLVEQASCLLPMWYDLRSCTNLNKPFLNRQDACSTKSEFSCGTGILPVADVVQDVISNPVASELTLPTVRTRRRAFVPTINPGRETPRAVSSVS
jgi:hypothetical protein